MEKENLLTIYNKFKKQAKHGFYTEENTTILGELYKASLDFLKTLKKSKII